MEDIKRLTTEDYQFTYGDIIIDSVKVLVLWNEIPSTAPLASRYEDLTRKLNTACVTEFSDADTFIILEKAVKMVGELKKRVLS